ncbi:PKD domain-containing protein [Salmonirosea aquatica]
MKNISLLSCCILLMYLTACDSSPVSQFKYKTQEQGIIVFKNESTNAESFRWEFGDSTYSEESNPAHQFAENGKYEVRLSASNGIDTSTSLLAIEVKNVVIKVPEPDFSYSIGDSGTVTFKDSSENAKTYQWEFGDGTYDRTPNPIHTYDKNGKYNVTLTASNGEKSKSIIATIEVSSIPLTTYVFYTTNTYVGQIEVYVDDVFIGNIKGSVESLPNPDDYRSVTYKGEPGRHKLSARAGGGRHEWPETYVNFVSGATKYHSFN